VEVGFLQGRGADGLPEAMAAYAASFASLPTHWPRATGTARAFFETRFSAADPVEGLLTGYFEPDLPGSLVRTDRFTAPLNAPPPELSAGRPWLTRAEIADGDALSGREIVWLESPLDAYFAQVQGSVRVRLPDGGTLRLGVAAKNGHPYRSIGADLIRQGEVPENQMSADAIRRWCARNPGRVTDLLNLNPSYVFLRILDLPDTSGPVGTAGVPLRSLRSLAVDPDHIPLGAPVWVESFGPERFATLMIAQDTGSAIRGPGRGDVFFGSGEAAGERAGRMKEPCRLTVLVPRAAP
jgi:membrane-bound lytic murein transglycosylase A